MSSLFLLKAFADAHMSTQIMKTKDAFANDDNFDPEEALEAAVDKRKFLMKRLFGDTRSTNTL